MGGNRGGGESRVHPFDQRHSCHTCPNASVSRIAQPLSELTSQLWSVTVPSCSLASDASPPTMSLSVPSTDAEPANTLQNSKGKHVQASRSYGAVATGRREHSEALGRVPEDEDLLEFGQRPFSNVESGGNSWGDGSDEEDSVLTATEYRRLAYLHALVPLLSVLAFILLAILPFLLWPPSQSQSAVRLFSAVLLSSALWSLSHVLRLPLHKLAEALSTRCVSETAVACLTAIFLVVLQELLRLSSFVIADVHTPAALHALHTPTRSPFHEAWFLALGWALAEVVAGVSQAYDQLALYRAPTINDNNDDYDADARLHLTAAAETLVAPKIPPPTTEDSCEDSGGSSVGGLLVHAVDVGGEDVALQLEEDLALLVNIKARSELEDVYGIPFVDIPVFISLLQRIDSIVLSLGLTLILSAAYANAPSVRAGPAHPILASLRASPTSAPALSLTHRTSHPHPQPHAAPLLPTLVGVICVHAVLALLHARGALPRIGVHVAAYVGLLVGLGTFFAGLAMWGVLS